MTSYSGKRRIWLSPPCMTGEEQQYVKSAFETNWVAPLGPNVDQFEKDLASYLQINAVAALSSGTAALHLALRLLNVCNGDEVLCSTLTFVASANPIVYQGATPVFVESELQSWNMSPEYLREAIADRIKKGKKPKALIVVDIYGMPANYEALSAVASEYDIPLIEDAAEGLGSSLNGKKVGAFGKISVLSFNGNKIITTSGGGALCSDDKKLVEQARVLSTQARDAAPHYQHSTLGYNYRMSNVLAGIGIGQLKSIDDFVAARRSHFEKYRSRLTPYGIRFLDEPKGAHSNRWLTTIIVNPKQCSGVTREDIRLALESENIEARPLWKPMHIQPLFNEAAYYGQRESEELFQNGLCLPSGSAMSDEDFERVSSTIANFFR